VLYNPLGQSREETVSIPLSTANYAVHDAQGATVASSVVPAFDAAVSQLQVGGRGKGGRERSGLQVSSLKDRRSRASISLQSRPHIRLDPLLSLQRGSGLPSAPAPFTLTFTATIPAFSIVSFSLVPSTRSVPEAKKLAAAAAVVETKHLVVEFDVTKGRLASIAHKDEGVKVEVGQEFAYYNASAG
jgi:hypothetical protein